MLSERGIPLHQLIIAGSPRFDFINPVTEESDISLQEKQILFVISAALPKEVCDQIDAIHDFCHQLNSSYKVLIRPHPYYKKIAEAHFKAVNKLANVGLDEKSFIVSLKQSKYVVFADVSTGIFEALALGKKVFILHNELQSKIDIYQFPKIKANQLLMGLNSNAEELRGYELRLSGDDTEPSFLKMNASDKIAGILQENLFH